MAMVWFVQSGDGTGGPYTSSQLKQLVQQGRITSDTELRRGSDDNWCRASDITGLIEARTPIEPSPVFVAIDDPVDTIPVAPPTVDTSRKPTIAGEQILRIAIVVPVAIIGFVVAAIILINGTSPSQTPNVPVESNRSTEAARLIDSSRSAKAVMPPEFNENDLEETAKWTFDAAKNYLAALVEDNNMPRIKREQQSIQDLLRAMPDTIVHWNVHVVRITDDAILLEPIFRVDKGGLIYFRLHVEVHEKGPRGFNGPIYDAIPIGKSVRPGEAALLNVGDVIPMSGRLFKWSVIRSRYRDSTMPMVEVIAEMCNVRLEN